MRSLSGLALAVVLIARTVAVATSEPPIPAPQGYVTDLAHVLGPDARDRLTRLIQDLHARTGAEIAVVTVDSTAPLDDFTYAMRIADAWKPGRKREDTGAVFLVAVRDRKLRILTGYGLEGILPDGLVGEIEDREVVPAFRAGRLEDGIVRGVTALAARIAAAHGVSLGDRAPLAPRTPEPVGLPPGLALVLLVLLIVGIILPLMLYGDGRRGRGGVFFPYGGFGGGGAGRSW